MEEEGTEILFRPGTETILKEHFSSQNSVSGGGELNLLQYCTTEETDDVRGLLKNVASSVSGKGESERQFSFSSSSSIPANEDQERLPESTNRAFFPASTRGQPPLSTSNLFDSVAENDESVSIDQDGTNEKSNDRFHPALKAALYTEGQEAVWHEDQCTTISSVYVNPKKTEVVVSSHPQEKPRNRMKIPFFKSRGKKQQPIAAEVEPAPRPVKIHIKKKKVTKAVLLLPPKEAETESIEMARESFCNSNEIEKEKLMKENEMNAAITENTIQARRLLDTVLSGNDLNEEESERVAKEAFIHAATARRIANCSGYDAKDSEDMNDDQVVQEAIELENVLSYLVEEGEQAALQHRRQQTEEASDEKSDKDKEDQEGVTVVKSDAFTKTKKKRRGKLVVSAYAARAVHYLESIIPKNIHNNKNDTAEGAETGIIYDKLQPALSSAEDFWSEAGMSTLGLKSDTLEYGFPTDEDVDEAGNRIDHDGAGLLRNFDMMSLSSLNEILDGGGTTSERKHDLEGEGALSGNSRLQRSSRGELSPRSALREIGIPMRKKHRRPPTQQRRNRGGFLGLMTPRTVRSTHNEKKEKQLAVGDDANTEKKWGGFFKTPRGSESAPSQLHLVLEEEDEDRSEDHFEDQSNKESRPSDSPSVQNTPASATGKEKNLKPTLSNRMDSAGAEEDLVEAYSDSCLGIPKDNRYTPAFISEETKDERGSAHRYKSILQDNEIELKLSVATFEDQQDSESVRDNKNALSEDANLEHLSSTEEKNSKAEGTHQEDRTDLSSINDSDSGGPKNCDRYHSEPIGKTPKRAGPDMEENVNRTAIDEETRVQEKRSLLSPIELSAKKSSFKEGPKKDQDDQNLSSQIKEIELKENETKTEVGNNNVTPQKTSLLNKTDVQTVKSHEKSKIKIQKEKQEEMSTTASEGSKSKIFNRVVDMIGRNKRKPLVPNTIVEEMFVVENGIKKISGREHHIHDIHEARLLTEKVISERDKHAFAPPLSKPTVGQRAKAISNMKKPSTRSSYTVINDSNTVLQQAISNGNLKAVESNEEGDDVVPLNYLAMMLKKKLNDKKVKISDVTAIEMRKPTQEQFLNQKPDADSFVAAIRGPRQKEAPGVALEEIAIRNCKKNRDPIIGKATNEILVDLAPTPRGPERETVFDDEEDETKDKTNDIKIRDPPIKEEEDERQRRKLITERLFQAGSSSYQDDTVPKREKTSGDAIKTVPTVASAESYEEEPVENSVQVSLDQEDTSDVNKPSLKAKGAHESNPHTHSGRGRRKLSISFLKGGKRK
uniref:Uncharacterized protein n=1 Tax=Pseudo-nitzschia australis TaxID=44445 RepID=A0A7S4AXJ5_9STRA